MDCVCGKVRMTNICGRTTNDRMEGTTDSHHRQEVLTYIYACCFVHSKNMFQSQRIQNRKHKTYRNNALLLWVIKYYSQRIITSSSPIFNPRPCYENASLRHPYCRNTWTIQRLLRSSTARDHNVDDVDNDRRHSPPHVVVYGYSSW